MSIAYSTLVKSERLQVVVTNTDAGPANGYLRVLGGSSTLALVGFAKPCGVVAGNILTFTVPQANSVITGGTCTTARIEDSTGTIVASGLTVGNSSGFDIVMVNTTIAAGDTLALVSATITEP